MYWQVLRLCCFVVSSYGVFCFQPGFDPPFAVLQTLCEFHIWNQQENLQSRAWACWWWLASRKIQIRAKKMIFTQWTGLSKGEMSPCECFRQRRLRPGHSDRSGARWGMSCFTGKNSNHDWKESPGEWLYIFLLSYCKRNQQCNEAHQLHLSEWDHTLWLEGCLYCCNPLYNKNVFCQHRGGRIIETCLFLWCVWRHTTTCWYVLSRGINRRIQNIFLI